MSFKLATLSGMEGKENKKFIEGNEYIWISEYDPKTKVVVQFLRYIDDVYCEVISLKDLQTYKTKISKLKEINEALRKNNT